jgi:hypothetical protein
MEDRHVRLGSHTPDRFQLGASDQSRDGTRMSRYFVIGVAAWYALPILSLMAG